LLWPVALKGINAEDQAWIWEQKHQFAPLGFMFIQENDEIFLVRMPIFAEKQSLQTLFYNLIKALHDEEESLLQDLSPMNILERIFAHMACRCSLWKGDILTVWEMNHLLRKLEQTPHFSQCNHGRPTYHFWSLKDLNRWFERT
jgi:DNA mismatch repair protein MutL